MSPRGRKPVQRREHGTRACYLRGPGPGTGPGCRCGACTRADYAWRTERERGLVRGDWEPWTDAEPARAHVRELMRTGLTQENVAALAGVAPGSMTHLMRGSNGNPPARKLRPETAARILAVRPGPHAVPGSGVMDSTGTVRRLQALVTAGWPMRRLAARLGMKPQNFAVMMRGTQVKAPTAAAVRALYDELWDQAPPEESPRDAVSVRHARAHAARNRWTPAMGWDDDTIDDPAAQPADWKRPASGRWRARDLAEEARELIRWGFTREQAAGRLGVTRAALEKAFERTREAAA